MIFQFLWGFLSSYDGWSDVFIFSWLMILSFWSSISFFQLVCPMTISVSSCYNVFDMVCSCLDSLFFSLFCLFVPVWFRWTLIWPSKASSISKNASSKVTNISPMMAAEGSLFVQSSRSCKKYRCLLRNALFLLSIIMLPQMWTDFVNLVLHYFR